MSMARCFVVLTREKKNYFLRKITALSFIVIVSGRYLKYLSYIVSCYALGVVCKSSSGEVAPAACSQVQLVAMYSL